MDPEDYEYVAEEHDRLISAISKLDKTQHITEPTRNEPTNLNSEFNLIKPSKKLKLDNVLKVLEDNSHNVKISKKLKFSQNKSKVLPKPLEKPQAERIKRAAGYEETKKKIGRWDPVIARNRTVDFVSFPLKTRPVKKDTPTNIFLSKLKLKSPLELELEEVDPTPVVEPEVEEEELYPMSYEEMVEHRQHLAKFRAQQSYRAAKAKRQSKIKSKKYHRILKKEKLKQQLKEFEELQATNPEEALKKLEELEKARALERHTLRHKNTGKWAKNKLVRAKYDKEVRQQLAEQLSVSRGLTQKTQNIESSDDEPDESENICDIQISQDPMNPWMLKKSDKSNIDAEFNFGYKKYLKDKMYKRKEQSDSEEDEVDQNKDDDMSSLKTLTESLKKLNENESTAVIESKTQEDDTLMDSISEEKKSLTVQNKKNTQKEKSNNTRRKNKRKIVSTSEWVVEEINPKNATTEEELNSAFDDYEDKVALKVAKKLKGLKHELKNLETVSNKPNKKKNESSKEVDNLEYLKLKKQKQMPIIDEPLIESNKNVDEIPEPTKPLLETLKDTVPSTTENVNTDIDPNRFIEVKPKYLNTAVTNSENNYDDLDDEEQVVPKVDIEEVFEEDDVVTSFRQEKEDEINKNNPEELSLTLPGWGGWAGKGIKAPKRKKNRFITKKPPKTLRRDENKGDVIINESKNPKLAIHKVSDLPHPFNSVKEYEESIRTPLGNTFVPETAHRKLIKPNVITRSGTIIEPMDEEELLVPRNRNFNNKSVIKILGKQ
ncbi:unnamed protein product [Danaus chrysippus]|uniref:(African queen) hypothetical protein n=1 Tax=Danaus chrysippus TaxID=151541 RepID=A0A8J2W263_9NEOP|nr:unnamed protein product [Danaus chrysippus]